MAGLESSDDQLLTTKDNADEARESLFDSAWQLLRQGLNTAAGDASSLHPVPGKGVAAPAQAVPTEANVSVKAAINYKGEAIHKALELSTHEVRDGQTVTELARRRLGDSASVEEVEKYAKEIRTVNRIEGDNQPLTGTTLVLPGHTADGAFVTYAHDGSKRFVWASGNEVVERKDGGSVRLVTADGGFVQQYWGKQPGENHGSTRLVAADGSYTEKHWFERSEQVYQITRQRDGTYLISAGEQQPHEALTDVEKMRVEHSRLEDLATSKITDSEELSRFRADMATFEQRAARQVPALTAEQIANTYREVERLFQAQDSRDLPLTESDRLLIAQQVIHQAAHPTAVDQGYHNTCNVTVVEARLYTRNPAAAAKLVADVATTGEFVSREGHVVRVPKKSLLPDTESSQRWRLDGQRSHASQIFQVTAINTMYEHSGYNHDGVTVAPGKVKYEQHTPVAGLTPPDTGERVMDYSKNPPRELKDPRNKKLVDAPQLGPAEIIEASRLIEGGDGTDLVMTDRTVDNAAKAIKFGIESDFTNQLTRLKTEGKFPVILMVHSDNEPFYTDGATAVAGGTGGWHVVTITDYDPVTRKVSVDNQWGSQSDHLGIDGIKAHDLYLATMEPGFSYRIGLLSADVASGKYGAEKEFELIRAERMAGRLDDEQLKTEVAKSYTNYISWWQKQLTGMGPPHYERKLHLQKELEKMRALLPTDEQEKLDGLLVPDLRKYVSDNPKDFGARAELLQRSRNAGQLTDSQLSDEMVALFAKLLEANRNEGAFPADTHGARERLMSLRTSLPKATKEALDKRLIEARRADALAYPTDFRRRISAISLDQNAKAQTIEQLEEEVVKFYADWRQEQNSGNSHADEVSEVAAGLKNVLDKWPKDKRDALMTRLRAIN